MFEVSDYKLDPPECRCARDGDDCTCDHCHECKGHKWRDSAREPKCEWCLIELAQWIHEDTDFPGCPYPALCDYSAACEQQWRNSLKRVNPDEQQQAA